ncbi:MAG: hypothetical protein IJH64_11980 [Oscillospiraceae bacterium]|nr:hypothetical protein [Oscillospiraceae bacterium]
MESGKNYKLGKIGSGIPLIQELKFIDYEDDYMTANYKVKPNGTTYLKVYGFGKATLKFTLADGKSYKVRINMKEEDEEI